MYSAQQFLGFVLSVTPPPPLKKKKKTCYNCASCFSDFTVRLKEEKDLCFISLNATIIHLLYPLFSSLLPLFSAIIAEYYWLVIWFELLTYCNQLSVVFKQALRFFGFYMLYTIQILNLYHFLVLVLRWSKFFL